MHNPKRLLASLILLSIAGASPAKAGNLIDSVFRASKPDAAALEKHRSRPITIRASWYGGGEALSRHTSSGEVFRPWGHTAAHRTLPFGTMVKVTLASTGRSTIVRINDRGPAAGTGRSIDLSRGAAVELGLIAMGSAPVILEVLR